MARRALALALALIAAPHASLAQDLAANEVTGCFDIVFDPPDVVPFNRGDSVRYLPPPRVSLEPSGAISVPAGSVPSANGRARWTVRGDQVTMYWLDLAVGLVADLRPDGPDLAGLARPTSDDASFGGMPGIDFRATRVRCSDPTPFPVEGMRRFVRSVDLASGGVLELGEPVPPVAALQAVIRMRRGQPAVALETLGAVAGNDSVNVTAGPDGTVESIRLHYPEFVPLSLIRDRLAAEFGPWTTELDGGFLWGGRAETMRLTAPPQGGRTQLLITDPRFLGR